MNDALSSWLQLREPADTAARSASLTRTMAGAIAASNPLQALDLATGTGSNLRYLAPLLSARQRWLVVDRDPALLALVPTLTSSWGMRRGYDVRTDVNGCVIRGQELECHVETRHLDLGALDDVEIFAGRDLVTASALLDLVSAPWLSRLAGHCRAVGAVVLFAITYDGRSSCSPAEPEDEMIRDLLNRHQRRDKGLGGPAAGPHAAAYAARCFAEVGYCVESARSDWALGPAENQLQRRLIEGWAEAATEMAPRDAVIIAGWRNRRICHVDADRSRVFVSHLDIAAWPPRS